MSDTPRLLEQLEIWPDWPLDQEPFDFEPKAWPVWQHDEDNQVDDSLACAVRVIRAILMLMPRPEARQLIAHIVAAKPKGLLAIAFNPSWNTAAALAEVLTVERFTSPEVFRQMMESKTMVDLFWGHPTMRLLVPSLRVSTTPTPDNHRASVVESLISVSANAAWSSVPKSMTAAVNAVCQNTMTSKNYDMLGGPLVVRCLYQGGKFNFDAGRFTLSWKDHMYQFVPDAKIKGKGLVKWAKTPKNRVAHYICIAAVDLGENFVSAQFYTQSGHPVDPIPAKAVRNDGLYMMYFVRNDAQVAPAPFKIGIQPSPSEWAAMFDLLPLSEEKGLDPISETPSSDDGDSPAASPEPSVYDGRTLLLQGPRGGSFAEEHDEGHFPRPPPGAPRGPRSRDEGHRHRQSRPRSGSRPKSAT